MERTAAREGEMSSTHTITSAEAERALALASRMDRRRAAAEERRRKDDSHVPSSC
jgi:hypothetical protein